MFVRARRSLLPFAAGLALTLSAVPALAGAHDPAAPADAGPAAQIFTLYTPEAADADTDTDGDGFPDAHETDVLGSDPANPDTDGDGLSDYDEVMTHASSPVEADADGDGLDDAGEAKAGTDPYVADTDGDGKLDGGEVYHGTDPLDPADFPPFQAGVDTDEDGLSDATEANLGTDPSNPDTDDDGAGDNAETSAGTDPLDPSSLPGDQPEQENAPSPGSSATDAPDGETTEETTDSDADAGTHSHGHDAAPSSDLGTESMDGAETPAENGGVTVEEADTEVESTTAETAAASAASAHDGTGHLNNADTGETAAAQDGPSQQADGTTGHAHGSVQGGQTAGAQPKTGAVAVTTLPSTGAGTNVEAGDSAGLAGSAAAALGALILGFLAVARRRRTA
ncbi:MAG: internalin, putative [uncultured Thermomicrobiales bacterium]|uniref:Internalin, putative n=1 Tax=uncultured Thermomicrobiales bacterium TaxID=1645740 RepID=A0A6J4VDV8_9BACT|nr:MAG: internalin, putative [uncultured Thermomicrobiales bacterium]